MNQYKDKTVLVIGHTGFKGSWLSLWLDMLGAKVVGISNEIPSDPANFDVCGLTDFISDNRLDIKNLDSLSATIKAVQPDFIFHLAAQSLVIPSYQDPVNTFLTNAIGTTHVLESVRLLKKDVVLVMITSDKVYDNLEWSWGYRETDRLGGKDPYSASKGMAEIVIRSYQESFFNKKEEKVYLGIARAGNVIGGGDWALNRIIPDCVRAWSKNETVDIRNPNATRPWQHVLEPLSGYLHLGSELLENEKVNGEAYNFGPSADQNFSVKELITEMSKSWADVSWNDTSDSSNNINEAGLLKLNCDKALADLSWSPNLTFGETVKMTANWYEAFYARTKNDKEISMKEFTQQQIRDYKDLGKERSKSWSDTLNLMD